LIANVLARAQLLDNRLGQVGPLQMKSFGHGSFCHVYRIVQFQTVNGMTQRFSADAPL
jgi:hypothetical protein